MKNYIKYIYSGVDKFSTPLVKENQELKVYVNSIECNNYKTLSPSNVKVNGLTNGDEIEFILETNISGRIINYESGNILNEQTLDEDSNQLFNLIKDLIGLDERKAIILANNLNEYFNKNDLDNSNFTGILSGVESIQEALNIINEINLKNSDIDLNLGSGIGGNNLPNNMKTLSDFILAFNTLITLDSIDDVNFPNLQAIVDYMNSEEIRNNELQASEIEVEPGVTIEDKLNIIDNINYLEGYNSVSPELSGPINGDELEVIQIIIDNYDADANYVISVDGGSFTRTNDSIAWDLPSVNEDTIYNLYIYLTKAGELKSNTINYQINVINL